MLASPTASVQPLVSARWLRTAHVFEKKCPLPPGIPRSFGTCPIATVRPSPKRNPVMTGFETKSVIRPSPSAPAAAMAAVVTIASAAESVAKRAASLPTSGPTADADNAAVAVVALTTSERDVPSSAYATKAPGAAISPASGGRPAISP